MSLSILNNISSLSAQNQLALTNSALQKTLYRLSSGSKLNSGADDAAGLSIANGLAANVSALTQSASNATNGVGKLQVADGALSQITSLLNRAVTLATESANGTVTNGSQRTALDTEFTSIKAEIDRIGTTTNYNGAQIFASGTNNAQLAFGTGLGTATAVTNTTLGDLTITAGAGGAGNVYQAAAGLATVGALISDINGSGKGFSASLDSAGALVVTDTLGRSNTTALSFTGTANFKIAGSIPSIANPTNSGQFNVFLSDSTASGSNMISVTLSKIGQQNLGATDISGDNLQTAGDATHGAQKALTDINAAITEVAAIRGNLGASVNRLTAATNVINNQIQNLTSAQDNISSADISTEVSNMTKYNVLTQTGISALSQSNQMQQALLKLLQ